MGYINLAEKTINAKLVYYGVGLGGKTTSLQHIHQVLCPANEVKLVSINTDQDATLLFDFLPLNLGQVGGFKVRIQGFTVPGQPKYRVMRKYVLSGADAVVHVVDSQACREQENRQALEDLRRNLLANGLDPDSLPIVLQYNKRDLPDAMALEQLDRLFNRGGLSTFATVATEGQGVFEAFLKASELLVAAKVRQYGLGEGKIDPLEVAGSAVERLLQIRDRRNRALPEGPSTFDLVTLTVPQEAHPAPTAGEGFNLPAAALSALEPANAGLDEELEILEDLIEEGEEAGPAERPPRSEGEEEALLGQVVQSNVELAGLYAELEEYKNLLERKNNELVEISQIVSHDLKKPLTALKTVISLLRQGYLGELTGQQADAIQNAYEASLYMEELIGDILDSTRIEHDGMELIHEEVDMTLLLAEIIRRLRYHLTETNVTVRVSPLPTLRCDPSAITKVFTNLLGNAINYRDPTRGPYISIEAELDGDFWVFRVEDNGIGIPEADQATVFKKFRRGSNTGGINGTGLGLYIVRELTRRHGGDVTFTSERDRGTTFQVRLPLAP